MIRVFVVLLLILSFSSNSFSAQDNYCEEFPQSECSAPAHDDGTISEDRLADRKKRELGLVTFSDSLYKSATQFMDAPENASLRAKAIDAFGLSGNKFCNQSGKSNRLTCNMDLLPAFIELLQKQIANPNPQTPRPKGQLVDFEAMNSVLTDQRFKKMVADEASNLKKINQDSTFHKNIRYITFPKIKSLAIKKISSLPIDEASKNRMLEKIKTLQYAGTENCATGLDDFFNENGHYNFNDNQVSICDASAMMDGSDFALAELLSHEIGHSVDPCFIQFASQEMAVDYSQSKPADQQYPIKGLISCLHSDTSLQARLGKMKTTDARPFCDEDTQIGEAVADWIGAEVMAEYIAEVYPSLTGTQWQQGMANIYKHLCDSVEDEHSAGASRVNAIFLTNPAIRQKMGCTSPPKKYTYCDAKNPDAMAKQIQAPTTNSKDAPSLRKAKEAVQ